MQQNQKKYEIGETTYVQRPLVLGQVRQLMEQLQGLEFDPKAGPGGIVQALGDRLHLALAVVLTPEGTRLKKKDLPAIADELEFSIELGQVLEVVDDFFVCNPLASIFEKLTGATARLGEKVRVLRPTATGSSPSASLSPAETSPGGTESSGATPSTSADPGSDTADERPSSERPS